MSVTGKCRHDLSEDVRCEDCYTDRYTFGSSSGAEHGFAQSIELVSAFAAKLFLDNLDEPAKTARAILEKLRAAQETQKAQTEKIRKEQKIGGR